MTIFFGLLVGFALLIGGGTMLVKGASALAERLGLSPIVIGLTIVAFGTSAPELAVNIIGGIRDQTQMAFGNVVGSNICNLGLVLGIAALCRPIEIHGQIVRRELPLLLIATSAIIVLAADRVMRHFRGTIDASDAVILLLLFGVFLYFAVQDVVQRRDTDTLIIDIGHNPLLQKNIAGTRDWLFIGLGLLALIAGGQITITSAVTMGESLNVPAAVIGLFVVGVGTSLPELVTSVIAALRRESDLALGNVIGSNLFNGLFVLPVTALIRPVQVPPGGIGDLLVSFAFAAVLIPVFWFGNVRLSREIGGAMLAAYILYTVIRFL